jgi:hypothetical protein
VVCAIRSRSCGSVADQGILNLGRQWSIGRLELHTGSVWFESNLIRSIVIQRPTIIDTPSP